MLRPNAARRQKAYSLVEVLVASTILAFALSSALAGMMFARKAVATNNLRAVALLNAQRSLEMMRSIGADELGSRLVYNGVAGNEFSDVWELDAVAEGLAEPEIVLRGRFQRGAAETLGDDASRLMRQTVSLVSNGDEAGRFERAVRVYLDVEWQNGGRVYREALFTIIY